MFPRMPLLRGELLGELLGEFLGEFLGDVLGVFVGNPEVGCFRGGVLGFFFFLDDFTTHGLGLLSSAVFRLGLVVFSEWLFRIGVIWVILPSSIAARGGDFGP